MLHKFKPDTMVLIQCERLCFFKSNMFFFTCVISRPWSKEDLMTSLLCNGTEKKKIRKRNVPLLYRLSVSMMQVTKRKKKKKRFNPEKRSQNKKVWD